MGAPPLKRRTLGGALFPASPREKLGSVLYNLRNIIRYTALQASLEMVHQETVWLLWIRAVLYMLIVGGGWLIILPLGVLFLEQGHFAVPLRRSLLVGSGLAIGSVGLGLALIAGYHLIVHGRGTPLPLDPPQRLVTSGPYAYVRNPQAIAMLLMVLGEILVVQSWLLWCLLPLTLLYLEGLVGPWEERQLIRQHGERYRQYQRQVRKWLPRSRAYRSHMN